MELEAPAAAAAAAARPDRRRVEADRAARRRAEEIAAHEQYLDAMEKERQGPRPCGVRILGASMNPLRAGSRQEPGQLRAAHAALVPRARGVRCTRNAISVIHGAQRYTWKETYARCRRLASALAKRGIGVGDTVAVMLPNIPAMYEAHFGVPMCGAVLNTLNTRLDAEAIAFMLEHGEAKVLIADPEFCRRSVEPSLKMQGPGHRWATQAYEASARRRAIRSSPGAGRRTSGRRSRSTTPRAPPATRRAWSTTTAAPT